MHLGLKVYDSTYGVRATRVDLVKVLSRVDYASIGVFFLILNTYFLFFYLHFFSKASSGLSSSQCAFFWGNLLTEHFLP